MISLTQTSVKTSSLTTRSEVELLLSCARTYIDSKTAERIRVLLQQDINWEYLIQTAAQHGVIPLLYQSLKATCPEAVPKSILNQLRNCFHVNALRNICLTRELLKLLNLFEENNITAIPLKGSVLSASIYGNLALRQFSDLDILVDEQDFLKATNLLLSQGYQTRYQLQWEYTLAPADHSSYCIDLHQGITPQYFPFQLDFESLKKCLEPASLVGTKVVNLSPEDLLITLCVQISKNCYFKQESLLQLCDINELIRTRQKLDWGRVMEQTSQLGSERLFYLGLCLTSELLGTILPKEVMQRMQTDLVVKFYAERICQRLFSEIDYPNTASELLLKKLMLLACPPAKIKNNIDIVCHSLRLIITPNRKDQDFLQLPASLYFLYYLIRPVRLMRKWGLMAWQSLSVALVLRKEEKS